MKRLRRGVEENFNRDFEFVCLTDREESIEGVRMVRTKSRLPGWWLKMELFKEDWRLGNDALYLDLDSLLLRNIDSLTTLPFDFVICSNFARAAQLPWPCKYGSCCMFLAGGWGGEIWEKFSTNASHYIKVSGRYGDQWTIEKLVPNAPVFQTFLPKTFISYRDLHEFPPDEAAVVVFGGNAKPDNSPFPWVREIWQKG